jgi:hypothetical protein
MSAAILNRLLSTRGAPQDGARYNLHISRNSTAYVCGGLGITNKSIEHNSFHNMRMQAGLDIRHAESYPCFRSTSSTLLHELLSHLMLWVR